MAWSAHCGWARTSSENPDYRVIPEIDVTTPRPQAPNYWRELRAARAAKPRPPWPAIESGLLPDEEGRRKLPAFPLTFFPSQIPFYQPRHV